MNYLFMAGFVIFFIIGAVLYIQMDVEQTNEAAVSAFVESRGRTPVPPSWRGLVGKGI